MTFAAAVKTPRRLVFVADSKLGRYIPVGPFGQVTGQQPQVTYSTEKKIVPARIGSVDLILAYAGEFGSGEPDSMLRDLANLGKEATSAVIIDRLTRVSREKSIKASQPPRRPPTQFLVGTIEAGRLRLVRVDVGDVYEAQAYSVLSIGGSFPWSEYPLGEDVTLQMGIEPRSALLRLVRQRVESVPADAYALPFYWFTATSKSTAREGWYSWKA